MIPPPPQKFLSLIVGLPTNEGKDLPCDNRHGNTCMGSRPRHSALCCVCCGRSKQLNINRRTLQKESCRCEHCSNRNWIIDTHSFWSAGSDKYRSHPQTASLHSILHHPLVRCSSVLPPPSLTWCECLQPVLLEVVCPCNYYCGS